MKISVIIAAYNAALYLEETLESVLNQTIDDYEVIVVNDGSRDNTLDILREYEKKYSILKIIDKENGGPSSARNAGLDIAQGEYIFFFDADDILELTALEGMYDTAVSQKAQLVIAGYDIFDNYTTTRVKDIETLIQDEVLEKYDDRILWTFSLSNKLFQKEIIDHYHFRLPPISYSEDGAFLMNYVYHIDKIVCYNEIIFHYRRLNGEGNAITETITDSKVKDYIEAHRIILECARESILRDHPEYKSIKEARTNHIIADYLNKIIFKELNILIRQFYSKIWSLEEETIHLIVLEIKEKMEILDVKNTLLMADENPDIHLFDLCDTKEGVLNRASFTAILYGEQENKEDFVECLKSLTKQNFVGIKIVVPEKMKTVVAENELLYDNIFFSEADTIQEFHTKGIKETDTKYIVFCDPKVIYANNAFKYVFKRFIKGNRDFISEVIHHNTYGAAQPVYVSRLAQESVMTQMEYNEALCLDRTLANKFFKTAYIKQLKLADDEPLLSRFEEMYQKGAYLFFNDGIVIYNDTEDTFLDFIGTEQAKAYAQQQYVDEKVDLNHEDILIRPVESFAKLQDIMPEDITGKVMKKAIEYYSSRQIQDRVLFVSIRKDNELEGNMKALYPYVKGEKVICAAMLPHSIPQMLKMIKLIATSKVIVTDDYVKYLRYFDLKPEQRVIQLWHACGAFKKFGQRGTNMALATDRATHAQYNMAIVSGEYIRPIYADAFDINLKKVKAMGAPRTDDFFHKEYIEEKKKAIYARHPELKDKFIIIYAPTFRDVGQGRQVFEPEIDFDRLSEKLLPNQQFLICPHPVMKNDIIPHKYDNIKVMRDFSTNDLMFISDMLITDYSSVIFEYALLNKPIAFYCYDLAIYNRGFYLNYPDDLPGDVYETQEALEDYLTDSSRHTVSEKHTEFIQKYMTGCDGHSCERISGIINSYMNQK